jgi:hypothetical protein
MPVRKKSAAKKAGTKRRGAARKGRAKARGAAQKTSAARKSATKKTAARKAPRGTKAAAKKAPRRATAKKSAAKRTRGRAGATRKVTDTAMKVLAGAAAGAVRAIIPPLEQTVAASEAAAGTDREAEDKHDEPAE